MTTLFATSNSLEVITIVITVYASSNSMLFTNFIKAFLCFEIKSCLQIGHDCPLLCIVSFSLSLSVLCLSHLNNTWSAYCIVLYCIILMGWSLLPNVLQPFKIYYALPNLGIARTWKCRLNFAQRSVITGFRFFNKSEISESGPPV